jgi:hypothetical protein
VERSVRTQLHLLINLAHERQLAQIAALPEAERDEIGTPERWSAKDQLAHTMYWKERLSERLAAVARGETPAEEGDTQSTNEANFEAHRNRPWADVLADDARIHAQLLANLDGLLEEALIDPAHVTSKYGDPLLAYVLGNLWRTHTSIWPSHSLTEATWMGRARSSRRTYARSRNWVCRPSPTPTRFTTSPSSMPTWRETRRRRWSCWPRRCGCARVLPNG